MPFVNQAGPGGRRRWSARPRRRVPIGELPDDMEEAEEARVRHARSQWWAELSTSNHGRVGGGDKRAAARLQLVELRRVGGDHCSGRRAT